MPGTPSIRSEIGTVNTTHENSRSSTVKVSLLGDHDLSCIKDLTGNFGNQVECSTLIDTHLSFFPQKFQLDIQQMLLSHLS